MDDLLGHVLDAHGGLERWSTISTITAHLAVGAAFWALLGFPDAFLDETAEIDTRREHAVLMPWTDPRWSLTLDLAPQRAGLQTAEGQTAESRVDPRSSFPHYDHDTFRRRYSPWDRLQVGYFLGYALWNYLTTPFLFAYPGVGVREIEPWQEDGETWRRLEVTFPSTIATHNALQVLYYDGDGMQRRVLVAHHTSAPKVFGGIVFPTRRIPVGAPATAFLAARVAAPEDTPFRIAPLSW